MNENALYLLNKTRQAVEGMEDERDALRAEVEKLKLNTVTTEYHDSIVQESVRLRVEEVKALRAEVERLNEQVAILSRNCDFFISEAERHQADRDKAIAAAVEAAYEQKRNDIWTNCVLSYGEHFNEAMQWSIFGNWRPTTEQSSADE